MDYQEIKLFIESMKYDLETINCLREFGRIKEILPVLEKTLERINLFRARRNDIKNIFKDDFWKQKFYQKLTYQEMYIELLDLSSRDELISNEELHLRKYTIFITKITGWIQDNILLLKEITKTPRQKMTERIFGIISIILIGIVSLAAIFLVYGTKTWGLKGDFYEGTHFENKISTGPAKVINFSNIREINLQTPLENCSARWQGFLIIPKDGAYDFYMDVDDGGRLWIDNQIIIDEWRDQNAAEFTKKKFLTKGKHAIRLDYYNHLGDAVLKLLWKFEGREKEIIPLWNLRQRI
ncbi:MAG: hypothetical protein HQL12_09060 [Candidatus Omnitrophica bacterium]|nr:hypothetical protein [Candidatus Omnitrophota bacterium]